MARVSPLSIDTNFLSEESPVDSYEPIPFDIVSPPHSLRAIEIVNVLDSPTMLGTRTQPCWCAQSLEEATVASGTMELNEVSETKAETVSFLEKGSRYAVGAAAMLPDTALADETPDVSLANFLSRPVQIGAFTWNEADAAGTLTTFNPWTLFFSNTVINNKLKNYAWLRCDLKIKVMVNASPFYYGAMNMSYQPLTVFKPSTIINDAGTRYFMPYSQRPHLWIYPQNNEGGEMTLPFFYPVNWLNTLSAADFSGMGTLSFINYTTLQSANGATGTGVSVTIYAWAENVVVSGPTIGLTLQAKDEYGSGPVSNTASAVAAAAKELSRIAIIKPYATATQMGAQAIADVASALGFCNTPVIEPASTFKPVPVPVLSSTEQGFPLEKLTIDPKNELTVDPTVVGLPPIDELNVSHLVQKESYITTATWSSASAVDTILFSSSVTPYMFDKDAVAQVKYYMTPSCWVGQLFRMWRGDVIFRFRFIATPFHRGRVRIIYDPSGSAAQNILNTAASQTGVFNEVIDLTKDTNVDIRVPYNQAYAWLYGTVSSVPFSTSASPTFPHVTGYTNGTIAMRVVTALTGPLATASIPILVSFRGADNLEFGNPTTLPQTQSEFAAQSADEYEVTPASEVIAGHAPSRNAPHRFLVNQGEQIITLRQILRRYNHVSSRYWAPTTNAINNIYDIFSRLPLWYGYDPTGFWSAKGVIVTGSNFNFNYVTNHPISYLASAFIGYRGAVNYVYEADTNNTVSGYMRVSRQGSDVFGIGTQTAAAGTLSANTKVLTFDQNCGGGAAGIALTNQQTNACLSVSCPMYSQYKFLSTEKTKVTNSGWASDDEAFCTFRFDMQVLASATTNVKLHKYAAAGTDFSLHFFLNVPTYTLYSAQPTAN